MEKVLLKLDIPSTEDFQKQIDIAGQALNNLHIKYNELMEGKEEEKYTELLKTFYKEKEIVLKENFSLGYIETKISKLLNRQKEDIYFDSNFVVIPTEDYKTFLSYDFALFKGMYPDKDDEFVDTAVRNVHEFRGLFSTDDLKEKQILVFEGVFQKTAQEKKIK